MDTKIFVFEFPSFGDLLENVFEALFDEGECVEKKCCEKKHNDRCCKNEFLKHEDVPVKEWEVRGKPADENLRFGAEFAVDEPRCQDYDDREEFEDDHAAFDRFVDAGEDCVERGLARKEGVTAHRCNAIRQRVDEKPPKNVELIGETDWFEPIRW